MKKLENYVKREADIAFWREHATPEDIDYYECQQELQQELLKSYNNVERIIGKYLNSFHLRSNFLRNVCLYREI